MTYPEAVDFLYSQLPMYSRIGKEAYKNDLTNTLRLSELLDHPEKKFRSIHVAGTNGKGSTSHMLAAILQTAGYKTGLYTSPHLKDFRERIRINGEMISEDEVTSFVEDYKDEVLKIGCSFFEWSVGLAFSHFAKHKVDLAVIETGLGGRLDSTNVITPLLSVITNISFDHMDMLGDTLEKIAAEKAGIIKHNVPVVIGKASEETKPVFIARSNGLQAPIVFADEEWKCIHYSFKELSSEIFFESKEKNPINITCDLPGEYQVANIITVLSCCGLLKNVNLKINNDTILTALSQVKKLTGLRGRWEILQHHPLIIADVAHNEDGLRQTLHQLENILASRRSLHFVLGFVKEKDISKILPLFPLTASYYFCKPNIPRGLDTISLYEEAQKNNLSGAIFNSVEEAYQAALHNAKKNDVIYVGGSTFVVAEVI